MSIKSNVFWDTRLGDTPISSQSLAPTPLTTAGAGVLTAALLTAGFVQRSGPTAAFIDTTDTAALIQAAWPGGGVGSTFTTIYQNNTAFPATFNAGTGVTLSGNLIVPAYTWAKFLVVWTGANTVTIYVTETGSFTTTLPAVQYKTSAVTTGSIAAGLLTGANYCVWQQTGNTPGNQLVRTAAQMLADTPNGKVGQSTTVRIMNSGTGTLTVAADSGATVTLTGTPAILTATWSDFILTFNTATTATLQQIGTGALT